MITDETIIKVRRDMTDYNVGSVYYKNLNYFKWDYVGGGVKTVHPRLFLFAGIYCTDIFEGGVAHSCQHGPCPHKILVVILKKDNEEVWEELISKHKKPFEEYTSKPMRQQQLEEIADKIILDLISGTDNPGILLSKNKNCYYIQYSKIQELEGDGCTRSTLVTRGHKLQKIILEKMKKHTDWIEVMYGTFPAYRKINEE